MFSFHTFLRMFVFVLISSVGSTIGEQGCNSSPSWDELHDEQAQRNLDNADKFGRITLDCGPTGGGSGGGNNGSVKIIELSVGLFFIIWVAIGIWFVFVRRQKAMNAAVAMSAPAGKLSNGDTKV